MVPVAAGVVANRGANIVRYGIETLQEIVERFGLKISMAVERLVEVGNVGAMVFVVMDLHGFGINVGFECVERVRQRGTVNATGFSSNLRFETKSTAVPECKAAETPLLAPSNPAPTIPVSAKNFRRFMGSPATRRLANRMTVPYCSNSRMYHTAQLRSSSMPRRSRGDWADGEKQNETVKTRHGHWMRESAQWADSAMRGSGEAESRVRRTQTLA